VARMAGMPPKVLNRANKILHQLEKSENGTDRGQSLNEGSKPDNLQLSFFQLDDPTLEQIRDELLKTDVNTLTPVEALIKLNEIKKLVGG